MGPFLSELDFLMDEPAVVAAIKAVIGDPYNQCYHASEAAYHLLGGRAAGYVPVVSRLTPNLTHWWLRRPDGTVLDITADQFDFDYPYYTGKGCGFMTKHPSRPAQRIIENFEHHPR